MASQISINIAKILNWCLTDCNIKLQVAFYSLKSHNYLAHKSTIGYFNSQSLILNTSFRINYNPTEHIILCKVSDLRDKNDVRLVGEVQIDLNLLADRKALFIPFQDRDKVLEVRIYEHKKENNMEPERSINNDQAEERREEFLQERFDFLDKLTQHQAQLKKKFSEKVYTLLKELKNKNPETKNEKQTQKSHIDKQPKNGKNELDFRNRLGQTKKRSDNFQAEPRNNKISPNKHKFDHELLIHSVHAKPEHKIDSPQPQRIKSDTPNAKEGLWQIKQGVKSERLDVKIQTPNSPSSPAFGGIINQYLNQYTHY